MWNEGERASLFIGWMFGALMGLIVLGSVVGTALCCGLASAGAVLVTVLMVFGGFMALAFVANGLIVGALALGVKAFRFFFPSKLC